MKHNKTTEQLTQRELESAIPGADWIELQSLKRELVDRRDAAIDALTEAACGDEVSERVWLRKEARIGRLDSLIARCERAARTWPL